jgi:hypothetical protein
MLFGSRVDVSVDGTCWSFDELGISLDVLKSDSCCWGNVVPCGGGGRVGDSPRSDAGERDRSCAK